MKADKILILKADKKDLFFQYIDGYNIESYFKYDSILKNRLIYKIFRILKLYNLSILYADWKKKLEDISIVIFFDTGYFNSIGKYIKKMNPNVKLYAYFWNPVNINNYFILNDNNVDKIYSFDYEDVKKYQLNFNDMFYSKDVLKKYNHTVTICRDIIFFGRPKERKERILRLKKILDVNNITNKIILIENENDYLPYKEGLDLVMSSKASLDITNKNQSGLTLRCMEAMFLKKKLITDNENIKKTEFYNENNILIINENTTGQQIKDFLNLPMKDIDEEIKNKYDISGWLNNFFN